MNPTPYTITADTPLPRVFNLYRSLGLRHVPVLRGDEIIGIITRKELTQHRLHELDHQFDAMAAGQMRGSTSGDGVEALDMELGQEQSDSDMVFTQASHEGATTQGDGQPEKRNDGATTESHM